MASTAARVKGRPPLWESLTGTTEELDGSPSHRYS
jgi:hypothetical protein